MMTTRKLESEKPERCLGGVRWRCGVTDSPKTFAAVAFGDTPDEAAELARMIIAAPELLSACKAALEDLKDRDADDGETGDELYAAIALAEPQAEGVGA